MKWSEGYYFPVLAAGYGRTLGDVVGRSGTGAFFYHDTLGRHQGPFKTWREANIIYMAHVLSIYEQEALYADRDRIEQSAIGGEDWV